MGLRKPPAFTFHRQLFFFSGGLGCFLRFVLRSLAWWRALVCSGWRAGCFCRHWYGWCRLFWSPERIPVTGVSPELCFQAQKGPIVLEVVLGSPLQFLVSVFSAVFFSPSAVAGFLLLHRLLYLGFFLVCLQWILFFFLLALVFSFYHVCLCESGREVPGGRWGWWRSFSF